jgi:hypothetical protein
MSDLKVMLVLKLPLPPLGGLKASCFNGKNILGFLEKYKDLYDDYKVTLKVRRERIMRYITLLLKDLIKFILEYQDNKLTPYNKEKFYKALKKEYRDYN